MHFELIDNYKSMHISMVGGTMVGRVLSTGGGGGGGGGGEASTPSFYLPPQNIIIN